MSKQTRKRIISYVVSRKMALLVTLGYTFVIGVVLLNRFWQFEAYYYDHGMMEGTAYQVAHLQLPLHHRQYGKVTIYVDHFYPSLQLVLAPFYWIYDSYETPVVVMAILIGSSVLIGYEIARSMIKSSMMIYALLFAYMFYIGMQNAIIFFVHDVTLQIPFLMLLFLVIIKRKVKLYYLLLLVNLGFKESFAISGVGLAVSLLFLGKEWRKHAIATFFISLTYGAFISELLIPYFRYKSFGSWTAFHYIPETTLNIWNYLLWLVDSARKRETILTSLATFGFLPLASPFAWPLFLQDFFQRFSLLQHGEPLRTGLNLYYNANLAVLMFVGAVYGVNKLNNWSRYRRLITLHAVVIILTTAYFHQIVYHGPLGLFYNRDFYKITRNLKFIDDFVKKVPTYGKIMTQNNLAVRFTHADVYLFLNEETFAAVDPDVVAIDFRPGQNPNNFFPMHEPELKRLADRLQNDSQYKILYAESERYIFVKKSTYE